jgi:hypothetical protein
LTQSTTVFGEAQTTVTATAQTEPGGSVVMPAAFAHTVTGTKVLGGSVPAGANTAWRNYPYSTRTAKTVTAVGATISSVQAKSGTTSIRFNNVNVGSDNQVDVSASEDFGFATGDYTFECWFYQTATATNTAFLMDLRQSPTDANAGWIRTTTRNRLQYSNNTSGANYTSPDNTIVLNQWNHVAVARSGTSRRIFFNGQLLSTATESNNFSGVKALRLGNNRTDSNDSDGGFVDYMDEVHVVKGTALYTANFTPTTKSQVNANTVFYMDGSAMADQLDQDSVTLIKGATADISAATTQDSTATVTHEATVDIASAMTATQTLTGLLPGDIVCGIAATQTTSVDLFKSSDMSWSSEFAVTADGDPFVFVEATWSSEFSISEGSTRVLPTAAMSVATEFGTDIVASKGIVSFNQIDPVNTVSTMSVLANQIFSFASEFEEYSWDSTEPAWDAWPREHWGESGSRVLFATTQQDTAVNVFLGTASANFNTASSVAIASVNTKPGQVIMDTVATVSTAPEVTHPAQATLQSQFGFVIILAFDKVGELDITAQSVMSLSATRTQTSDIPLVIESSLAVLGGQDGSFTATESSEFSFDCFSAVEKTNQATFTSAFTTQITATPVVQTIIMQASLGTFTCDPGVTKTYQANFNAQATQVTVSRNLASADLDWQGFATQITIGQEIQTDPYRQITVASELRTLRVLPEARIIYLPSESRVVRVPQPPWNEELLRRVA